MKLKTIKEIVSTDSGPPIVVLQLLHCCPSIVALLSSNCCIVVLQLLNCCPSIVALLSSHSCIVVLPLLFCWPPIVALLSSHCIAVFSLLPCHCSLIVALLSSHCCHVIVATLSCLFQVQSDRLKENVERVSQDKMNHQSSEQRSQEIVKRMERQLRDVMEEQGEVAAREAEASQRKHDLVRHTINAAQGGREGVLWHMEISVQFFLKLFFLYFWKIMQISVQFFLKLFFLYFWKIMQISVQFFLKLFFLYFERMMQLLLWTSHSQKLVSLLMNFIHSEILWWPEILFCYAERG